MANVYFNDKFEMCSVENSPEYLYVDNVGKFLQECGDEWISDDVKETGVYRWDNDNEVWTFAISAVDKRIREIVREVERIKEMTEHPCQGGRIFVGWNILITLDTGETIKTNSEPVSMNEVQEAINILLKPSFFGKRIQKFEIVAE